MAIIQPQRAFGKYMHRIEFVNEMIPSIAVFIKLFSIEKTGHTLVFRRSYRLAIRLDRSWLSAQSTGDESMDVTAE